MRYLYNRNINILIKFLQIIMNRVKELLTLFMFDNHKIVEKIMRKNYAIMYAIFNNIIIKNDDRWKFAIRK